MKYQTTYDEKTKTWYGVKKVPKFNPNVSLGQVMLEALQREPNKIGQISDDSNISLTNGEIYLKAIRATISLMKLGFKKGDVFGFMASNTEHLAPIVIAAFTIGAACNAIEPSFKKDEVSHMFNVTKPAIIFCDNDQLDAYREAMPNSNVPIFTFRGKSNGTRHVEDLFIECEDEENFVEPDIIDGANTTAIIMCSSGTTGFSKAVCMPHSGLLYQLTDLYFYDKICMSFSTLYWGTAYMALIIGTVSASTRIISNKPYNPKYALDLVERYKISVLYSVPSMLASMLAQPDIDERDLSSIQLQLCGGSIVHPELVDKMNKYIPNGFIMAAYGLSELNGALSLNYPKPVLRSVGQIVHGAQVRIINDNGERCGINEDGEICGKTLYPFLGYYNNPEETKKIYGEDDFIHTGDIGRLDENGNLYVIGRKKDIFKYKCFMISPSELENLILTLDGVLNVCVVGVPDYESDIYTDDIPAALVVRSGNVTEADIYNLVKETLCDAKQLRGGVYFVDKIPMTYSGKPLRREVPKLITEIRQRRLQPSLIS